MLEELSQIEHYPNWTKAAKSYFYHDYLAVDINSKEYFPINLVDESSK